MKTYQVSQSLIENHEQATGKIWELQESSRDGVPNRMLSVCYLIYRPCYTMNLLLGCPMFSSKNLCGLKSQCSSPPAFQANRFPSKLSPSKPRETLTIYHRCRALCSNTWAQEQNAQEKPVPSTTKQQRHGVFSGGGASTERESGCLYLTISCCFPDLNALYLGVSIQSWARRVVLGFKGLKGVRESQFVSYPCGWLASGQTTLKQRFHQGWFETVGNQSFPMWKFQ